MWTKESRPRSRCQSGRDMDHLPVSLFNVLHATWALTTHTTVSTQPRGWIDQIITSSKWKLQSYGSLNSQEQNSCLMENNICRRPFLLYNPLDLHHDFPVGSCRTPYVAPSANATPVSLALLGCKFQIRAPRSTSWWTPESPSLCYPLRTGRLTWRLPLQVS